MCSDLIGCLFQLLLLLLMLFHHLGHPALHQFLLELAHLHVGFDGGQLVVGELLVELFYLWG